MQNKPVVTIYFELRWYYFQQLLFHLFDIFTLRKLRTVTDAENMSINRDSRPAESGIEHYIGRFSAHTRQSFQCRAIFWYFTVMFLQQNTAGLNHIFCF